MPDWHGFAGVQNCSALAEIKFECKIKDEGDNETPKTSQYAGRRATSITQMI
jgi:hypothetical protein